MSVWLPCEAGAVPQFHVSTFDFSGAGGSIRIDADGNPYTPTLPSVRHFYPADVNSSGVAAGVCNGTGFGSDNRACVYDPQAQAATVISAITSGAYDINEAGDVLWGPEEPPMGNFTTELHILRGDGTDTRLGFTSYGSRSFNSRHDVVGRSFDGSAFYFFDEVMYDLQSLVVDLKGLRGLAPTDINDRGFIGGWALDSQGRASGFLLRPIPEPGTWTIAGLGLLALGLTYRQRSSVSVGDFMPQAKQMG